MSDRYYRKKNNKLKNFNKLDQTVDELKNIILGKNKWYSTKNKIFK